MLVYLGLGPPPAWLVFRKRVSWRVGKNVPGWGALACAALALSEADRKKEFGNSGGPPAWLWGVSRASGQ